MTRLMMLGAVLLAAGGCVQTIADSRVRTALLGAGLSDRVATCMAERMVDRLTIAQLRRLEALRQPAGGGEVGIADYLARVRRVGDAEVIGVTSSSAALCAVGIG